MTTKLKKLTILLSLSFFLIVPLFITSTASAWWFNDRVNVMTQNMYLGADIFAVLEAAENPDPALGGLDVPIAVAELFQTVQYTNFPERAEAIANQIWFHKPHLIGLQEVSQWYIQSPGDAAYGGTTPADVLVYDYLQILLDALAARGLNYKVAVEGYNADVELPMLTGFTPEGIPTFDDLRLVDRDVILVRGDVHAKKPVTTNYLTNASETVGNDTLTFTRGWVAVDVKVCGDKYRFVSTHLEVRSTEGSGFRFIQSAQMQELLTELSSESKPIILVGDFNSSPTDVPGIYVDPVYGPLPYVPPYMQAVEAGYLDAWDLILWPRDGFTSGFSETIDDPHDQLTSRIDMVFLDPKDKWIKWVIGTVVGDNIFNMTPSGLWPSDHGGVVARVTYSGH